MDDRETAWIGLGGNVGDVETTFATALARLDAHAAINVTHRSSVHGTTPIGEHAGDPFRNMAAGLATSLSPHDLLALLHDVERALGRTRDTHWGPRTLDLDLLLHGDRVITDDRLTLPHPAMWYRRFVLDPLAEIAPDVVHPERGATIGELRERLLERPLRVAIVGGTDRQRRNVAAEIGACEGVVESEVEAAVITVVFDGPSPVDLPRASRLCIKGDVDTVQLVRGVLDSALG